MRKEIKKMLEKKDLSAQGAKTEFINDIYSFMMKVLDDKGKSQYKECFVRDGSSIMCNLPADYFNFFNIPENTRIEIKFIAKK